MSPKPSNPDDLSAPDRAPAAGSADPLLAILYDHLRAVAQQRMNAENAGHTLQATALVHEVYLRIGHDRQVPFRDRAHFFATAAEAMRRILIDHARAKSAAKRQAQPDDAPAPRVRVLGGKREFLSIVDLAEHPDSDQILALDAALVRLEEAEPEVAQVVRLRFFAGLGGDETAEALSISPRQVDRLWAYGRAWLSREVPQSE